MIEIALVLAYIFVGTQILGTAGERDIPPAHYTLLLISWPFVLVVWLLVWKD